MQINSKITQLIVNNTNSHDKQNNSTNILARLDADNAAFRQFINASSS